MIDTICIQFNNEISRHHLENWGFKKEDYQRDDEITYKFKSRADNSCIVSYNHIPNSYTMVPLTRIEFSIPNLLYGDNLYLPVDLDEAIKMAIQMLPLAPGVSRTGLIDANLFRIDPCYNFYVGSLCPYYIRSLQLLHYPYRTTLPYMSRGVVYKNKGVSTKLYDKAFWYKMKKKPVNQDAIGMLRFESTIRKDKIEELMNMKKPKLKDLTSKFLMDVLENDQRKLGMKDRSIGTYDTTLAHLGSSFSPSVALRNYALIEALLEHPTQEAVLEALNMDVRAMKKRIKKMLDAGIVPTMTDAEVELPPLVIDRNFEEARELLEKRGKKSLVKQRENNCWAVSLPEHYEYARN